MTFESYRFNDFDNAGLAGLYEKNVFELVSLGKDPGVSYADDGREQDACFLGFRRRDDASYILYAYVHKDREYGFLWETFFDEAQRAASGGEPHVWYDDIREGHKFRVRVSMKDPKQHVILEEPFTGMNEGQVLYLGDKDLRDKEGPDR